MKRGFSRMLWGGIILLVVLFFVSVYGVKEGFGNNQCVQGQTYSEPKVSSDGKYLDKYLDRCFTNTCKLKTNATEGYCYSGTPNSNNKLTSSYKYYIKNGKVVKR